MLNEIKTIFISMTFIYIFFKGFNRNNRNIGLLTVLFSFDRSKLLNITFSSFFHHIYKYEKKTIINFHFVDSGTPDRLEYINKYNIKNVFYMNPNHAEYSYGMFWSYLHGSFILFMEDDWPFIRNIETHIFHPNFIEESILILQKTNLVKGIILKRDRIGKCIKRYIKTSIGDHILCILIKPPLNFYYVNGPSIYKIDHLLQTGYFESELAMSFKFKQKKWYTGFTYKGINCSKTNPYTTKCQGVAYHMGKKYSTLNAKNRKVCNSYLY